MATAKSKRGGGPVQPGPRNDLPVTAPADDGDDLLAELAEGGGEPDLDTSDPALLVNVLAEPSAAPTAPEPGASFDSWMDALQDESAQRWIVSGDTRFIASNGLPVTLHNGSIISGVTHDLAAIRAAGAKLSPYSF